MLQAYDGDVWYGDGDSIGDRNFQYQWDKPLQLRVRNQHPRSRYVNTAVSGATIAQIDTRTGTNVPIFKPTIFIAHLGINDVRTAVPVNTSITGLTNILNRTAGAGVKTYIIGPFLNGEKSDGTNGTDNAIVTLDNAMAVLCATYSLCTYRSIRSALYPNELTLNTPPPGTAIGPYTRPDTTPGVHCNPFGRAAYDGLVQLDVVLN